MLRSLPLILLAALALASPASAQVLTAAKDDPAERPDDPGRDIRSLGTSYDPAGIWRVAVRFYAAPTAETSALLRVYLGERAADGTCEAQFPNVALSMYTDPADRGGKVSFHDGSVDVVKQLDADGAGFSVEIDDARLGGRSVCGLGQTSLSRKEPFDSVPAFEFPGAPAAPAPAQPAQPGADAKPTARMTIVRDRRALRRGVVRVSVRAASEKLLARATLYGPGRRVLWRHGKDLAPEQEVLLSLRLGARAAARLRRTGRLEVGVVTQLLDETGNRTVIRRRATLRR